jgi:hypothetical protein
MASGHINHRSFLLIFLNGSNRSVSLDFGKTTIQKAQLQSLRFGLACCRGIAAKKQQRERNIRFSE